MPTNRRRRRLERRQDAMDLNWNQCFELLVGNEMLCNAGFADTDALIAAWDCWRDALLPLWIRLRPGSRPAAWWICDMPGARPQEHQRPCGCLEGIRHRVPRDELAFLRQHKLIGPAEAKAIKLAGTRQPDGLDDLDPFFIAAGLEPRPTNARRRGGIEVNGAD